MKINKKKAFTLTELLVVVVIIGVLAAVVLPKFNKVMETRKTTEAEELMAAVRTEQEYRCAIDKPYIGDIAKLSDIIPNAQTKHFNYSLETTGMLASSKGKYSYELKMPSYADGRVCCEGTGCDQLNKDYPTCDELKGQADYKVSTECTAELASATSTCLLQPYEENCSETKGSGWSGKITHVVTGNCEYQVQDACNCDKESHYGECTTSSGYTGRVWYKVNAECEYEQVGECEVNSCQQFIANGGNCPDGMEVLDAPVNGSCCRGNCSEWCGHSTGRTSIPCRKYNEQQKQSLGEHWNSYWELYAQYYYNEPEVECIRCPLRDLAADDVDYYLWNASGATNTILFNGLDRENCAYSGCTYWGMETYSYGNKVYCKTACPEGQAREWDYGECKPYHTFKPVKRAVSINGSLTRYVQRISWSNYANYYLGGAQVKGPTGRDCSVTVEFEGAYIGTTHHTTIQSKYCNNNPELYCQKHCSKFSSTCTAWCIPEGDEGAGEWQGGNPSIEIRSGSQCDKCDGMSMYTANNNTCAIPHNPIRTANVYMCELAEN